MRAGELGAGDSHAEQSAELDGLRGLTILLVLSIHFQLVAKSSALEPSVQVNRVRLGGVDLFFGFYALATGVSVLWALLTWNLFERWFLRFKSMFAERDSAERQARVP